MTTCVASSVDVALLGCGNVGTALARLAAQPSGPHLPVTITSALVRDPSRPRPLSPAARVTADARALFATQPAIVIELLGGTEPARPLLLEALGRRIPVVTANKSLLARHGSELRAAAAASSTPLLYEAAVVAGVPFLGTFARRPQAAAASGLVAIVNGTSNFVLTQAVAGASVTAAVTEAQRLGYAEPDPRNDLAGIDAAEKLAVLIQHFAHRAVHPDAIETRGIEAVSPAQLAHARELGGVIKPVVTADWSEGLTAFAAPAFVPAAHPLARVDGVENAVLLDTRHGRLLFQGPGAGPAVTAATVLDDVREIAAGSVAAGAGGLPAAEAAAPETEWLITIDAPRLPRPVDVADLLAAHGLFTRASSSRRTADGQDCQSFLTWRAIAPRVELALASLRLASGCTTAALRALEVPA
jgi:homoserine dehydrogenase